MMGAVAAEENPLSSSANKEKTLGQRIASGVGWSALARVSIQLSVIAASTVVARRVPPSAYGVVGMAVLVTGFVTLFRDLGTNAVVIQKRELSPPLLSSLYWLNVATGFVIGAICFLGAPLSGMFFREPAVVPVLRVLSISFPLSSFATIQTALLRREMAFKKISLIEIGSSLSRIAVVVTLACLHFGVWSLVASTLTDTALSSLLLCAVSTWRPNLCFSWAEVRSVMNFGLNLSAFNLFNYFARNADNIIVGRVLGSAALGFYQLAYNIMFFPVQAIAWLLTGVLLPAFSEIQHDNQRFRQVYLRACRTIALVTFPLMTGVGILAAPLIKLVYGPKWVAVIPLVVILAPVGLAQSIYTTNGQIYVAKGRTDLHFRYGGIAAVLYVISFLVGLPWGIQGVALSYAICNALIILPQLHLAFRLIELRLMDLWQTLKPVVGATILMALVISALRMWVGRRAPIQIGVDLLLSTTVGTLAYAAAIYFQNVPEAKVALHWLSGLRGRSAELQACAPDPSTDS